MLSSGDVFAVAIGIGVIALAVVLLPLLLSWLYGRQQQKLPQGASGAGAGKWLSFFQLPYITWFLVHYGIAALAILAIVFLAVDGVIDSATVSALLGSLFGYVLASSSRSSQGGGNAGSGGNSGGGGSAQGGGAADGGSAGGGGSG